MLLPIATSPRLPKAFSVRKVWLLSRANRVRGWKSARAAAQISSRNNARFPRPRRHLAQKIPVGRVSAGCSACRNVCSASSNSCKKQLSEPMNNFPSNAMSAYGEVGRKMGPEEAEERPCSSPRQTSISASRTRKRQAHSELRCSRIAAKAASGFLGCAHQIAVAEIIFSVSCMVPAEGSRGAGCSPTLRTTHLTGQNRSREAGPATPSARAVRRSRGRPNPTPSAAS